MALYRTGTASMDAQGVITGVGTKWREPLSLIRTGATIVFLTTPLTLAVISDIVSDTEMKAIQTEGAVVPDGNYVILLNDSLTVDGMAQDVAETLRYYQSKETEIADALEFFRDFDLQGLKDLVARIEQAAKDTDQAKLDAQAAQSGAEAAQQATNQIKQETQTIKDSAVTELTQIKDQAVTDVTAIKDQAVSETTSIKNEALDARDAAEEAQFAAEESKAGAETAKAGAETARDQAEEWAKQVNPENLLHKDQNLADVPDKELARTALDVPAKSETFLIANNFSEIADRAAAWLNMRPIGATPLGGDPVNDYDATTKRWVENYVSGGGGVGPTMNGVQNFGVGERTLWDSRAFIPQWAIPADGQLLNRADWPELWEHAQMHTPIVDSDWIASPSNRGRWSLGDGSTTFRVPDLNGAQSGSIRGLYGRGDGGGFYVPGTVFENGAPDATGTFRAGRSGLASGVFSTSGSAGNTSEVGQGAEINFVFSLSSGNAAYGRSPLEVRGNNFAAVWIIRASGGFTAANTSWSVNNRDEAYPDPGVVTVGGKISSNYYIGDKLKHSLDLQSVLVSGQSVTNPELRTTIYNDDGSTYRTLSYTFSSSGYGGTVIAHMPGQTNSWGDWQNLIATQRTTFLTGDTDSPTGGVCFGFSMGHSLAAAGQYGFQVAGRSTQMFFRTAESGNFQAWQKLTSAAVSDATLKTQIEDTDGSKSLDNIRAMVLKTFVYKDDEQRRMRRGVIAQQIRNIDPCYVKEVHNGDNINLVLDSNPLLMDALAAIKKLSQMVDDLKTEIEELKASK